MSNGGYMPSYYNSIRFQKAKRINELEAYKLEEKMRVIDKNRKTILDVFQNDIRLLQEDIINLHISSGISEEGRPPSRDDKVLRSGQIVCYVLPDKSSSKRKMSNRPASSIGVRGKNDQLGGSKQRPQTCPPGNRGSFQREEKGSDVNGRGPLRLQLRTTDNGIDLRNVDESRRTLRPLTAPSNRRRGNKRAVDRPYTAGHEMSVTTSEMDMSSNNPEFENETSGSKYSDSESREEDATDNVESETTREYHVVFASEAKVDIISDDLSTDDATVTSERYDHLHGRPPQTRPRSKSMFLKIDDLDDDDDDEALPTAHHAPRVFVPPPSYWKSDASRKSALKKYRDPRTLLLRQGSRNNLFSQVGEEDLTKALARHMSRQSQKDPTTPTHASRQKAIGGYSNRKTPKRTNFVQVGKRENPGSVSHNERRRKKLSLV
ncbi:uncharacterized protein LOC144452907 [Glandiceps talaboti]